MKRMEDEVWTLGWKVSELEVETFATYFGMVLNGADGDWNGEGWGHGSAWDDPFWLSVGSRGLRWSWSKGPGRYINIIAEGDCGRVERNVKRGLWNLQVFLSLALGANPLTVKVRGCCLHLLDLLGYSQHNSASWVKFYDILSNALLRSQR